MLKFILLSLTIGTILTFGATYDNFSVYLHYDIMRECPGLSQCMCGIITESGMFLTNCSGKDFKTVPENIPLRTQYLDISYNDIASIGHLSLAALPSLEIVDLRENPSLEALPLVHGPNFTKIYVDRGTTCCIYEMETWKVYGWHRKKRAKSICHATEPYTECDKNLLDVGAMIIFLACSLVSLVCNPWVLTVTLGYRRRRKDPIFLTDIHYSTSNILTTVYALVIFGHAAAFYDNYHYHMEDWMANKGCGFVGYMLITVTILTALLYMLQSISLYLKLIYPLTIDKHMTRKKHAIITGSMWISALFFAAFPFFFDGHYNDVGLCLPFYPSPEGSGFKYLIMYMVILCGTLVVNTVLLLIILRKVINTRKNMKANVMSDNEYLQSEMRQLKRSVIINVSIYLILVLITVVFLIVACVGGYAGKVGRTWFAILVIIYSAIQPLISNIRKPQFRNDTLRLLYKWRCYKGDNIKARSPSVVDFNTEPGTTRV